MRKLLAIPILLMVCLVPLMAEEVDGETQEPTEIYFVVDTEIYKTTLDEHGMIIDIPAPTKEGSEFKYWIDSNGRTYSDLKFEMFSESHTFYAIFNEVKPVDKMHLSPTGLAIACALTGILAISVHYLFKRI